jgi:hypothetical protein
MLERCRRTAAEAGRALIPAASPLAVGDYLVTVHAAFVGELNVDGIV